VRSNETFLAVAKNIARTTVLGVKIV